VESLGLHIPSLIVYLVNFGILLLLLYLFAYKPILRMLDQRSQRIRESLEAAESTKQQAAQSQAEMKAQLEESRREAQRLIEEARQMADRYRQEEQAHARQEVEAFIAKAREDIRHERDDVMEEVRKHFADLAIVAAEKVVQRSVDRRVHAELIEQVLKEGEQIKGKG
jgi:F-type H+-transporting ATPase subunit b